GCLGADLARELWPGVALVMGWVSAQATELRALSVAPGVLRSAAARAASAGLKALAAERPLMVLVDDTQFLGQAALDALELATTPEAQLPLWVCVFSRPSLERSRPDWGARAGGRCSVRLEPLDRESAGRLCRQLLSPAENVPAGAIEKLVSRTQ